ncbi:hypothetical protein [Vibrio fortis]|uniref:hypothetical protein n=1 Tax=Vibrio fortis TaxID=212667 RepID=UPI003EBC878E
MDQFASTLSSVDTIVTFLIGAAFLLGVFVSMQSQNPVVAIGAGIVCIFFYIIKVLGFGIGYCAIETATNSRKDAE